VVVDNNSTDNTREVVAEFHHLGNVRYCAETHQGLSRARNRGWQMAEGEYVAYVDDDCRVPEHWLAVAKEVIEQVSPAVFGGPYFPFYLTCRPAWFKDSYASSHKGDAARPLSQNEYLSGGNIFLRRSLLEELDGFDTRLGMRGDTLGYGEETEMQRRIRTARAHELIYYDPRLCVYHLVSPRKMSLHWIARQRFVDGRYSYHVFSGDGTPVASRQQLVRAMIRAVLAFIWDMVRSVFVRDRTRYQYIQNYLYEQTFAHLRQLGQTFEGLKCLQRDTEAIDTI
jgi:glycosyltransferase involved in cell wall biosynthesis